MQHRQLGKTGMQISEISFGCMSLGKDQQENNRLLHAAVDSGINFFDTADLYDKGWNETTVGIALKEKRSKVFVATKVGNQWKEDGSGWEWNPRKEYIISAVEQSLKRLQTDYIDLYQLHGGTIEDPFEETIEAFEWLNQQGKIKAYGISSIRPNVIRRFVEHSGISSVMMQYSLLDRRPEESCLSLLQQHGIGVLARGGLAQGLLAGKPANPYLAYTPEQVSAAAGAVAAISGEQRQPTQTALRFILQHPAITSAVVGIRTMEQLTAAVQTTFTPNLTTKEIEDLQRSIPVNYYDQHR